nr:hypothetical protein [Candidatus Sigynarchaeota archaeon]
MTRDETFKSKVMHYGSNDEAQSLAWRREAIGVARRLRKQDIEKRLAICERKEREPWMTWRALQAAFKTSPAVVGSALTGGTAQWRTMLGGAKPEGVATPAVHEKPVFLALVIEAVVVDNVIVKIRHRDADGGQWVEAETGSIADVVAGFAADGWDIIGFARVPGSRGGAFAGTYECLLRARD